MEGEGEVLFEEEILSDISQAFSDEDDDAELAAQLNHQPLMTKKRKRLASENVKASESAANVLPAGSLVHQAPRFSSISLNLPSVDDMEVIGPIAKRTRAQNPLVGIDYDELDALLAGIEEPLIPFQRDEAAEYLQFLESLRVDAGALDGGQDTGSLDMFTPGNEFEDDSDDEDFMVEVRRFFEWENDLPQSSSRAGAHHPDNRHYQFHKLPDIPESPTRPKIPHWAQKKKEASASAATQKMLQRLRPRHRQPVATALLEGVAYTSPHHGVPLLSEGHSVELPSDPVENVLRQAKWIQPLPAALRKFAQEEEENMEETERPMRENILPIAAAAFVPHQYTLLYKLIHQHTQLLLQTYAMAANNPQLGEHVIRAAHGAAAMLDEVAAFQSSQQEDRIRRNIPPYLSHSLGIREPQIIVRSVRPNRPKSMLFPGLGKDETASLSDEEGAEDEHPRPSTQIWYPLHDGPVFTVVDAAPLRIWDNLKDAAPVGAARVPTNENRHSNSGAAAVRCLLPGAPSAARIEALKKSKKKWRLKDHPLWNTLPQQVQDVFLDIKDYVDPRLVPKVPRVSRGKSGSNSLFSAGEDELLAWGLRKYGLDYGAIHAHLLPTRSVDQMKIRKKNACAAQAANNSIKQAYALKTNPLTLNEVAVLEEALNYYGKEPNRWKLICKRHLKYREPKMLAELWARHTMQASLRHPPPGVSAAEFRRQLEERKKQAQEQAANAGQLRSAFIRSAGIQPLTAMQEQMMLQMQRSHLLVEQRLLEEARTQAVRESRQENSGRRLVAQHSKESTLDVVGCPAMSKDDDGIAHHAKPTQVPSSAVPPGWTIQTQSVVAKVADSQTAGAMKDVQQAHDGLRLVSEAVPDAFQRLSTPGRGDVQATPEPREQDGNDTPGTAVGGGLRKVLAQESLLKDITVSKKVPESSGRKKRLLDARRRFQNARKQQTSQVVEEVLNSEDDKAEPQSENAQRQPKGGRKRSLSFEVVAAASPQSSSD